MAENGCDGVIPALQDLCLHDKICSDACSSFIRRGVIRDRDVKPLLNVLAGLLLSQQHTLVIANHLSDLLLQIIAVALSDDDQNNAFSQNLSARLLHEKRCVALGKLAVIHPDVMTFGMKYFNSNPSPFYFRKLMEAEEEPRAKKRKVHSLSTIKPISDKDIALCCYSFLKIKTNHFRYLWDWSIFLKEFLSHADPYIRWISCQCCALLFNMESTEKETLLSAKLSIDELVDFSVKFTEEENKIKEKYSKISFDMSMSKVTSTLPHFYHETVTSVAGITLPSLAKVPLNFKSSLVMVKSTQTNLQAIALGIATGKTLCLQGPVGCGKTALVEHLAKLTGHDSPPLYLSVQLGDQTDSKMLLGTYQCTDIPGEFVWKPGVLTQAVVGGYWLLLEDIDSCTTDVAAVLASLLETGTLSVPGFKDCVHTAPGFQLFFTQRLISGATGLHKLHSGVTNMLQRHWLTVQMEPLSESELVEVVQTLYPSLHTVATRMVKVFLLFSAGNHHTALSGNQGMPDLETKTVHIQATGTRLPSTRDFIKWCNRASVAFDVKSPESGLKLLQDAVDIFCCNVSNPETRLGLASSVAARLGVIHTKAEYFCNTHKPVISCTLSHVIAGRVTLPRKMEEIAVLSRSVKSTYSFTRPAAALLERIASCIHHSEPVLLVGETGVGKTSSIQYLAQQMGQTLSVINMNQQSDSADLLGGYKPVELKFVISPLRDEFETLFRKFFSVNENVKYLSHIANCFSRKKWTTLVGLMKHTTTAALKRFDTSKSKQKVANRDSKTDGLYTPVFKDAWQQLSLKLEKVEEQLKKSQSALAFAFVEGSLVRALQEGEWVLLDEINLASAQTLECLSSLLEGSSGSLYLLERGDEHSIKRHPNFRIFAAMNPATDVGKKELPAGIRNRFSEFFVDELVDRQDLLLLCGSYLAPLSLPASRLDALVTFYLAICKEAVLHLSDGTGHKPHYSLRTLCRALSVAAVNPCGSVPRSLYEGILLSFLTQLDRSSHPVVENMVAKAVVGNSSDFKSLIKQPIPTPVETGKNFVQVEGYWVTQGPLDPITPDKYIMTKTVRQNLRDLVRVVSLARLPVLLQGETSVGKTSLITYLAQVSGNRCLRINNHEHTDLQEYIGCYAADQHGNLVFKEGVLVEAMRFGHWVILDELNLAPSDVLEALNRVLDDNRELFIPETQKVVKAHPNFMLFATQNPPGLYGGRKVLSRAFRNRFIELHFDEIPSLELETIMHLRCDMPPSYCKKMVAVMSDLQVRRKGSAAFAGKQGFITLRDLFRWGERYRLAQHQTLAGKYYDWDQHIADEGYLILAGRVRKEEERIIIQESLKKHIKRSVCPEKLFTLNANTSTVTRVILESIIHQTPPGFHHIVWTYNMRRLAVLLGKACEFKEPILLVGETGCGKTTLCQLLAASRGQSLAAVNCHMNSESADFLGGLRPVREHTEESKGKLFEWVDGPLIEAMQTGGVFLADEISLADDSVLERLNSLLEPERKLLLAEKGSGISGEPCEVTAKDGFIFVGTMNPGGDYGKKELSPALRNRFTEIWCEGCSQRSDMIAVIEHNLRPGLVFRNKNNEPVSVGTALVNFLDWFSQTDLGNRCVKSIRDIMTWIDFINVCTKDANLNLNEAYIHGACLTFLDSLGTGLTSFSTREVVQSVRVSALKFLMQQVKESASVEMSSLKSFLSMDSDDFEIVSTIEKFGMKPFYIPRGSPDMVENADFMLSAPTTHVNAMRVLRGLQLGKALLLEGSPGVGKTSLVSALAQAAGYKLTRINLSDQTDVSDLFGADLPVEGGSGGEFAWRDGPFLQALRAGHWILLDELNLASQSVLEGLNAVLDHRGDLFIPELGRTFHIQSDKTRLFACQNPLNQGGARKGLPQSFLNRFTQVYMETLTFDDLEYICQSLFPHLPASLIKSMVNFNQLASIQTAPGGKWGQRGAPWEMNLRDLTRWCEVTAWGASNGALNPGRFVQLLYVDRMRTARDKEEMMSLYTQAFGNEYPLPSDVPQIYITPETMYLGDVTLKRGAFGNTSSSKLVLRHQLPMLQSLGRCMSMGWLSILVGPAGCGKTSLVHLLAQLAGRELRTLAVNSAMDTTEILGGFEQADYQRHFDELVAKAHRIVLKSVEKSILQGKEKESNHLLGLWENFLHSEKQSSGDNKAMASEVKLFSTKIDAVLHVLMAIPEDSISVKVQENVRNLQKKLSSLKDSAVHDNSLNAGGKFEWIDSILIKSLIDGCWLLVDNVNLCSAAVLDRLNGLLEPQGVLTVSERGVNSNGELVTIHPHPEFRLFLTMDPRHGEISRAMRNRGVEIYIASSEEDMSTSLSPLDLSSLLYDVGICSQHDQQMLLRVHEALSNVVLGPDPPGLTELLHASFMLVQQVHRGMPPIPSLISSFTKVYIQSRLLDNVDIKRRNLSILEEAVNEGVQRSVSFALDKLISDSTLKTREVHEDSEFAMVRQRCSILSALANAQEHDLAEVLEFLGISKMKVDLHTVIVNLTILFYQMCSVADVSLASKWLEKVVRGSCHEETINQLSKAMLNVIVNVDDLAKCHLMWDRRWLPDVSSALSVLSGDDDQGVENRVASLLYVTAHSSRNKYSFDFSSIKKHKHISVLEYSQAISKGVLTDSLASDPILTGIGPFLDISFDLLYDALNTIGVSISDELWWSLRKAFLWIQRFQKQAASVYVSSDKAACEEISNVLAVHYRWFSKYAIPVVIHLAGEASLDVLPLSEAMQRMNASVFSNTSVVWRLAKKLRQKVGQPLPVASELQATLTSKALQVGSVINMWKRDGDSNDFAQVANFLATPVGHTARASLTVAVKELMTSLDLSKVEERLVQAEKYCSEAGLYSSTLVREQSELPHDQISFQILLWPFMEAVCLHAIGPILLKLFQDQTLSSYMEETYALIQAIKMTPSIPASLVGFFEAFLSKGKSQELSTALSWLFRFSSRSLAISNSALYLSSPCDAEKTMEFLPQHCPLFSYLASNLLFCHNPSSKQQLFQPTLDRHFEHAKLLSRLRSLLWQNSENLATYYSSFRYTEVNSILAASQYFINSLEKSCCLVPMHESNLEERATSIIKHLEDELGDKAFVLSGFYSLLLEFVIVVNIIEQQYESSGGLVVENGTLAQVGSAWALLGCLESQLFSAFPKIDPTSKDAIKRKYTEDDLLSTNSELLSAKMIGSVKGIETNTYPAHPHLKVLRSHAISLEHELSVLNRQVATRPNPPLYSALTKELEHLAKSLSSEAVVTKVTKRLMSVHSMASSKDYQTVLNEAQTWLRSQRSFATMLDRRFGLWYPDIVGPLLAASAKLIRGVELMVGVSKKIYLKSLTGSQHITLSRLVCSIGSFPSLNSEQTSFMNLISHMANGHMPSFLEQILVHLVGENEDLPVAVRSQVESYWLLKSSVLEVKNAICVSQSVKNEEWDALVKVLRSFTKIWEKQEADRREMEQDNESLYKSRGALRCEDVSDDAEALKEIAEMFPSKRENDFGDLESQNRLDDKPTKVSENVNEATLNVMIDEEDMALVSSIHVSLALAFTKSAWISGSMRISSALSTDYLTPWLQRSAVAARLISSCGYMLDDKVDHLLLPSWILASYQASPNSSSVSDDAYINPEDSKFDFYRSPCMSEAKQCKPVLDGLLKRVSELLSEWPEHPTLNQIVVVINRINSFPIESPLARFLTGLEILLTKMKEWEENAHSGVSLANQSAIVTNLIIQWRRLELSVWKGCLNSAAIRMENRASRWWFYIFSLIDSYVHPSEKEPMGQKEIVSSLERFMEDAPLGEFHVRLDMILAFHCHVINLPASRQKDEVLSVLWNLYHFYLQFKDLIGSKINDLKKPIEKKLKDYVKIARWNDINYWAVKETVFKTQRTLHKHVKEFEVALRQAAKMTMLSSRLEGKSQRKMPSQLNPTFFIAIDDAKTFDGLSDLEMDPSSVLYRAGKLFSRSKKLSKEIILSSECPGLVAALDELSNDIAESVQQLASLDVDQTAPKAKQKSQAKNHLQMKRKALSDLFRMLQRIGLSHHTGLTYEENDVKHEFTKLPPLDLSVFLQALNNTTEHTMSPADKEILSSWDGCNAYLMRSWARYAQLSMAVHSPHKDHGPPNIERLKGFPAHILTLAHTQHRDVEKSAALMAQIRVQVFQLKSFKELLQEHMPSQSSLHEWNRRLESLLVSSLATLQQFKLLLNCCPERGESTEDNIPVIAHEGTQLSGLSKLAKGDGTWQKAMLIIDEALLTLNQCKKEMATDNSFSTICPNLFTLGSYKKMTQCFNNISVITSRMSELLNIFGGDSCQHPCIQSLKWLMDYMLSEYHSFSEICEEVLVSTGNAGEDVAPCIQLSGQVNDLMQTLLLAVQKLYKDRTSSDESIVDQSTLEMDTIEEDQKEEESDDDLIQEKHLTDCILKSLASDLSNLNGLEISQCLANLLKKLMSIVNENCLSSEAKRSIRLAFYPLPLLQQWVLLYQFIVQHQVAAYRATCKLASTILAVFGDLAVKGFCTPEGLLTEEEAGEGEESESKGEGAMGLGDGEGEKDMSDRIESEDQLEDARPAGEEKKDEDKDCKEEEKGIEMSDNFDGKLQDVDPKGDEEDEDDKDEDDKDAEKEMGDTEKEAEQLDQQIWGSDSEEEGDEGENEKEEEGQSGEQTGEKEVGAKERETNPNDDGSDEKDSERKQENKPEINEMDDPEVDDDQIDPYHGNQQPEPEPDAMDLPDDLQLDDGEGKDQEEKEEENPFDIDEMKEKMPPESKEENQEGKNEDEKRTDEDKADSDISDDDDNNDNGEKAEENPFEEPTPTEEDLEEPPKADERKSGQKQEDVEDENDSQKDEEPEVEKPDADERNPSNDDPTAEQTEASEDNQQGSMDQVASLPKDVEDVSGEQPPQEADGDPGGEEKDSVGQAPNQELKGHHSDRSGKRPQQDEVKDQSATEEKQQPPGHSDSQRSLGDVNEPMRKRLKTVDLKEPHEEKDEGQPDEEPHDAEATADLYQHIKDVKEQSSTQTLDAATKEQAEEQPISNKEDEEGAPPPDDNDVMEVEEIPVDDIESEKQKEEIVSGSKNEKQKKEKGKLPLQNETDAERQDVEVDGEKVDTLGVSRAPETTFHTRFDDLALPSVVTVADVEEQSETVRRDIQNQLSSWNLGHASEEATQGWQSLSSLTNSLARDLSEQLRLVLEPTQATRMKGDFRTGRRINMRKVIPYIASQFRKDKIWMRRTKPHKREYQIMLAIDDSSSMADNRSKELAFESLALVSQALTLLEAGELGVLSFGEVVKVLHRLGEPFTQHSGARLLQQFSFDQRKTQVGVLVDYATTLFASSKAQTTAEHAQLLVVISDGRGVFSEGQEKVCSCVRRARLAGIFMVFVIIDNPENKDSILDIRTPIFSGGKLLGISSYMDTFPFPFYLILRDISNLPAVLSDALRQWFELVSSTE